MDTWEGFSPQHAASAKYGFHGYLTHFKKQEKNTEGFSLFVAEYQLEPKCVLELADEGQAAGHGVLDMALTPSHIRG